MKGFHGLDHKVAQVDVEADRPSIQEAFIAEDAEREILIAHEICVRRPREVGEGPKSEGDLDRDDRPPMPKDHDVHTAEPGIVEVDRKEITNTAREYGPRCAGINQGFRPNLVVSERQVDVDGRTEDRT